MLVVSAVLIGVAAGVGGALLILRLISGSRLDAAQRSSKLLLDDALWKEMSLRQIDYARKHFSRSAFRRAFLEAIGVARSGN